MRDFLVSGRRGRLVAAFLLFGPITTASHFASAGPLTEAHVTKVINDVKLIDPAAGQRPAKLDDVVHDQVGLATGVK